MSDATGAGKPALWYKAPELPRCAPFGSLRAVSPRLLRFSTMHFQTTYGNVCRDRRVTVTMVAAPDIAVSVRGRARVVRERMRPHENRAIVEVDIAEVKNDMAPTLVIENGITISPREEYRDRFRSLVAEVEGSTKTWGKA